VTDPYAGREQTEAKHFILKRYLEELAFKILTFNDIAYVDGFSGPWEAKTENFSDSSFMIAIGVLKDAQKRIYQRGGKLRRVRCFLSESNAGSYAQLKASVVPFHDPENRFEVKTFHGEFEDAVTEIQTFIGSSFPLIFIDPTGWSGYPFDKIKPLFAAPKCEVLVNFMYDFVNRFSHSADPHIVKSLDPILGGPGWQDRLDATLARGAEVERLFRETLQKAGNFAYVVSTRIDRATAERPHFFIAYGTKNRAGLIAFREAEYAAQRSHAKNRANANEKKREEKSRTRDLFAGHDAQVKEETIDDVVDQQMTLASYDLLKALSQSESLVFSVAVERLLQPFMLRETNVKDICVRLSKAGKIENTWGGGNRKPRDGDEIRIKSRQP
jgi:three-Cys-motif partner protein